MKPDYLIDCTVDGKCSQCGQCCSDFLPMTSRQVKEIRRYVRKHNIKQHRHNVAVGYDITCPFRNEQKRTCEIYPVRPWICKQFMCNHSYQDIMNAKFEAHRTMDVIFMRREFFNSNQQEMFINGCFEKVVNKQ